MILALTIVFILIVIAGCSISHLVGYNKGFNDAYSIIGEIRKSEKEEHYLTD